MATVNKQKHTDMYKNTKLTDPAKIWYSLLLMKFFFLTPKFLKQRMQN